MTEKDNVFTALVKAQADIGVVHKNAVNPHFKSKYADLASIMNAALPALNANGIAVWHTAVMIDGVSHMRTTLSHGMSDTHISCDIPLMVSKNDMQGMKSATTYAKRIGVESLTGIAPEDDDGNAAAGRKQEKADPNRAKSAMLIEWIEAADVRSLEEGLGKIKSQIKELQAASQPLAVQVYNVLKAKAEKEGIVL